MRKIRVPKKIARLGIVAAAIVVLLACLFVYYTYRLYQKSYMSEYRYIVMVETDSILYGVTLYLPLPVLEGESKIGDEIIAGDASMPDDWDCSIIETEYGKMLRMDAEKMVPVFHSLPIPIEEGQTELPEGKVSGTFSPETPVLMPEEISVVVRSSRSINTKSPSGSEPLLSPEYNLTLSICELPHPEGGAFPKCYEYESRIYADYAASADAEVSIYIGLVGGNSWWTYGWSGNQYRNTVSTTLSGVNRGWQVISGELVEGEGRYGWI